MARRKNNANNKRNSGNSGRTGGKPGSTVNKQKDESSMGSEGTGSNREEENSSGTDKSTNDPEWYMRDPRLTLDACSLPFSTPFGSVIKHYPDNRAIPGGINYTTSMYNGQRSAPGICSVRLKPSVGNNFLKTSPLNVCANAFYTHVRYINSGRKNYDPADLMLYALVFGDLYSYLIWCQRLYAYAFNYSQRNWYIGRQMIIANGVDPDDIISNLANFRYWINSMVNKLSSFCLPGDIYFFRRRAFLYQNYYIENPYGNIKDQMYQFVPDGFFMYDLDANNNNAGKLTYLPRGYSTQNIAALQAYFDVLISNITGDEDFGLMSGDVLKAYGTDIITLSQMGPEVDLPPVFDSYVLSQFKNCFYSNRVVRGDSTQTYTDFQGHTHVFGDIEQNIDGLLISCETVDWSNDKIASWWSAGDHIISVENPDPDVGTVIEATRLMPQLQVIGNPGFYAFNAGTEIAVGCEYTEASPSAGFYVRLFSICGAMGEFNSNGEVVIPQLPLRSIVAFKYSPISYAVTMDNVNPANITAAALLSNVDNHTLVTNEQLQRIHEVALLSLFYVPGVAKLLS